MRPRRSHLRAVPHRPSVIVDTTARSPVLQDFMPVRSRVVPPVVQLGMVVAAWARAEHCGVTIARDGRLELRCRHSPSSGLETAFAEWLPQLVAVIGWAVPTMFGARQRAFAASWSYSAWGCD